MQPVPNSKMTSDNIKYHIISYISNKFKKKFTFSLKMDLRKHVKNILHYIPGFQNNQAENDGITEFSPETRKELNLHQPQLFISGHSHILKVMYDEKINCLHINPGAAGKQGWHKVRTLVRLTIDGKEMKNCEVIELGR
jgi:hypothetical protein